MSARGLSVREIRGHLLDLYGIEVSPDLISAVTDAVLGGGAVAGAAAGTDVPAGLLRRTAGQVPAQGQCDQVLRSPERPADRDYHQQSPGFQGSARHRPEPAPAKAG